MKTFAKKISTTLYAAWLGACMGFLFHIKVTDPRFWVAIIPTILFVTIFNQNRSNQD